MLLEARYCCLEFAISLTIDAFAGRRGRGVKILSLFPSRIEHIDSIDLVRVATDERIGTGYSGYRKNIQK